MENDSHTENGIYTSNNIHTEDSPRGKNGFRQGTGLSNIKAVAEKYHGAISIKTQGGVFFLNVLLIIPQ